MAAQSRGSVKVSVQSENGSLEAMPSAGRSAREVRALGAGATAGAGEEPAITTGCGAVADYVPQRLMLISSTVDVLRGVDAGDHPPTFMDMLELRA
jgi:hypothetical protein